MSYGELTSLAVLQSVPKDPPLKSSSDFRLIGKEGQRSRVDALDKSTGKASFGADVQIPNKVCAYVLRSPVMGGRAKHVNFEKALQEPGVLDVVQFERGVAVLAEKYWQAKRASQLVEVGGARVLLKGLKYEISRRAAKSFHKVRPLIESKMWAMWRRFWPVRIPQVLSCNMRIHT